jgi:DNA (cytosine-5)-methyltransferase 1
VLEYAKIQEFPDYWEFYGSIHEKYIQIGNAVPVILGKLSGKILYSYLANIYDGRVMLNQSSNEPPFSITYINSHIRTRQWYKKGKTYLWDDAGGLDNNATYLPNKTTIKQNKLWL